jgi:DNA-binding MarR family transcriptional regulator
LSLIENTDRVNHALAKLRNADIDTVLKNIIVSISLKTDRVVDVTLSREQHDTLRTIIDKTNHVTSELIEKFDSGVEEIKLHIGQIKALGERLEHMSVGPKHKPFLKEILDELNLTTKDITSLIRDIQSLVLHLVIKY